MLNVIVFFIILERRSCTGELIGNNRIGGKCKKMSNLLGWKIPIFIHNTAFIDHQLYNWQMPVETFLKWLEKYNSSRRYLEDNMFEEEDL